MTDIGSPLFKVDWPGRRPSQYSPKHDQFNAGFGYEQQDEVLEKCVEVAKAFQTDRVRGFDFWRLEDQAPYRKEINAKLQDAASRLGKKGIIFVLENEYACNTATGAEAAEDAGGSPDAELDAELGPGQRGRSRRGSLSERMGVAAEEPHRTLPLQRHRHERRRQGI